MPVEEYRQKLKASVVAWAQCSQAGSSHDFCQCAASCAWRAPASHACAYIYVQATFM